MCAARCVVEGVGGVSRLRAVAGAPCTLQLLCRDADGKDVAATSGETFRASLVGKAVLAVLYTRFPGSVIVADECEGELTCSAEEAWTVGVEYATKALPAHAFVPNLGRYFPKRMWDKVRRYDLMKLPLMSYTPFGH